MALRVMADAELAEETEMRPQDTLDNEDSTHGGHLWGVSGPAGRGQAEATAYRFWVILEPLKTLKITLKTLKIHHFGPQTLNF